MAGLGRAYAAGLAKAQGAFVAILEGDDMWSPTQLADELPLFDDESVVLAYGAAGLMDERGCVYAQYRQARRGSIGRNDPIGSALPALVSINFIVAVTVMIRRSTLDQIGGFYQPPGVSYVDHPTLPRLATAGMFARSPRVLGLWRRYSGQVTTRAWLQSPTDRTPYLRRAAADARDVLAPVTWAALQEAIRRDEGRQREEAALARARMDLIEGRCRQAGAVFNSLARKGEARTRAVALLGIVAATCRTDLEWLIRAMGRRSLPSRRHIASHRDSGRQGNARTESLLP